MCKDAFLLYKPKLEHLYVYTETNAQEVIVLSQKGN